MGSGAGGPLPSRRRRASRSAGGVTRPPDTPVSWTQPLSARLQQWGVPPRTNVTSPPGDAWAVDGSAQVRGCWDRVHAGQPGSGSRINRCVRGLARTRGARRTVSRRRSISSFSRLSTRRPRPLPQGRSDTWRAVRDARSLSSCGSNRGSAHLLSNRGAAPLSLPPLPPGPKAILLASQLGQQITRGFLLLLAPMLYLHMSF